ncbi:YoaH family protein [uncultured Ferrimonas sp.]|uniref:YoaH family protein n=1 Tax=uncultured Ferrimonas sp. TaxID=432640 RepID=UPI002626D968|nr:YoaH family protein [uncultured Ferrimonas sp.]
MSDLLGLTHEQQQQAVERIQALMATGVKADDAIKQVAQALRDEAAQAAKN